MVDYFYRTLLLFYIEVVVGFCSNFVRHIVNVKWNFSRYDKLMLLNRKLWNVREPYQTGLFAKVFCTTRGALSDAFNLTQLNSTKVHSRFNNGKRHSKSFETYSQQYKDYSRPSTVRLWVHSITATAAIVKGWRVVNVLYLHFASWNNHHAHSLPAPCWQ